MAIDDFTVHIVDDEEAVRKSLAFMLSMNGHAVRVHDSATAFLNFAVDPRRAVLITDLRMPDMSGVELIRALRGRKVDVPAIVITGHGDVPLAVEAMKAGAVDFIEKPFEDTVIVDAIARASERLHGHGGPEVSTDDICKRMDSLSEREKQVLYLVIAGHPNKSIAFELDISARTVEVHRANVMAKMQSRSLPDLVRMVLAVSPGNDPTRRS
jgi:two-component system, LuxR family, response regulator FixJ